MNCIVYDKVLKPRQSLLITLYKRLILVEKLAAYSIYSEKRRTHRELTVHLGAIFLRYVFIYRNLHLPRVQ